VLTVQSKWLLNLRVEVKGSHRLHSVGCHGWRERNAAYTAFVGELMEEDI